MLAHAAALRKLARGGASGQSCRSFNVCTLQALKSAPNNSALTLGPARMEGFLRHDLSVNRGRPDLAANHDNTAAPDTPVAKAAAQLLRQDLQPVFGPYLRFNNWDINTSLWTGSVLIVAHHSVTSRPFLNYNSSTAGSQCSEGVLLDTYGQHNFWRFGLGLPLAQQSQILTYSLNYGPGASMPPSGNYDVHLPGRDQPWHWGFHSCSGFSLSVTQSEWGGVAPLWNDLLDQHRASPIHLVVGGGDQLYNDALFKVGLLSLVAEADSAEMCTAAVVLHLPFDLQVSRKSWSSMSFWLAYFMWDTSNVGH